MTGPCYIVGVDGKMTNPSHSIQGLEWSPGNGSAGNVAVGRTVGCPQPPGCQKDLNPHPPCLDITLATVRTGATCIKTLLDYMTFEILGALL